jgi:transcriptional regulator with XRE-family HTH domain
MARTSFAQKVGKRIKQVRLEKGFSQEQLGLAIDVSQTYISEIESGTHNISLYVAYKIANSLGVRIDDLTNFDDYQLKDNSQISRHP